MIKRHLFEISSLKKIPSNIMPIKTGFSIEMIEFDNYEKIELQLYQRLISKLIYFACNTRLDNAFTINQLSKHNANPRKNHLKATWRVVWYLKETMQLGLVCGKKLDKISSRDLFPYGYSDYTNSNFTSDPEDWKLVMRHFFFLNGVVILWSSKKQRTVSISITKAVYIALGYTTNEAI